MLIAGIVLGICILLAGGRRLIYMQQMKGETAAETAVVEETPEDTKALETMK